MIRRSRFLTQPEVHLIPSPNKCADPGITGAQWLRLHDADEDAAPGGIDLTDPLAMLENIGMASPMEAMPNTTARLRPKEGWPHMGGESR
jgi:hypothetical protein